VAAAVRLVDGVIIVVDVVEGVMANTEAAIKHAMQEGVALTLVLNKIDRLVLELRMPPADAYYKIRHTLEEVNNFIRFVVYSPLCSSTELSVVALTQIQICVSVRSAAMSHLPARIWVIALRFIHLPRSMLKLTVNEIQYLFVIPP
jgi:U5 small nuclear ribonucleoprotein component